MAFLTGRQTVEAVAFNLTWHYALDIRCEADTYVCERTLRTYRNLLIEHGLDEVLFRTLTDQLIERVGVDTRRQRLDSTGIRSFMRSLTRLGILVEAASNFLRELQRLHPRLADGVASKFCARYVDKDGDHCFALTHSSEVKQRLPEAATDVYTLLTRFTSTRAATLESYHLLERVFEEQREVEPTLGNQA